MPVTRARFRGTDFASEVQQDVWTGWWYCEPEAFNEFYDVPVENVVEALGAAGWHEFDDSAAEEIARGLDALFAASE